ncbi:7-carboxy-7-deazaguanine synthase [Parathalassolituus penaei]|uniref:7-carboxy-7-deazaguanine synthase n=1 Tax=Parathalassolituus penaei TaxID=2997323 RepID=A0A9X3ECL7_9GAMM|nr:7-carboxy-7-deazaguanine synthase [Parathalassolituus penaei]MCY0965148.1 7-carboxy-7-deazaguanine synthase [Parathalassolituus penaei]
MSKSKTYRVKEIFYSLQGEGAQTGRPSIFCRFSKCNLWNGREDSRVDAVCNFCDTDFVGTDGQNGGTFNCDELTSFLKSMWPSNNSTSPYIVFTGGEPALQLDETLVEACHACGFEVAIETNGTLPLPAGIDWICLSPKGKSDVVVDTCNELKLVYPQADALPERFEHVQAQHYYLQPMANLGDNEISTSVTRERVKATIEYCLTHPRWKLSLQTHKWLGID